MRYMQEGGFQQQPLMRMTLGLTLSLLVGFWLTNFGMYFSRMGLSPRTVVAYYNGSEEEFRPPRSLGSMLETTHSHLPVMGIVLLVLTHLAIFIPMSRRLKVMFILTAFTSAALEEGAGWLVRFVDPAFAILKPIGFVGLQGSLLFLTLALLVFLLKASRRQAAARAVLAREREAASLQEEGAIHATLE